MFVGFWLHGFVTISILLKQMHPSQTERFVVCATSHTFVQIAQVLALSVAAVLGDQQMTFTLLGHTNREVQPRRLFWLVWIAFLEAIVFIPLCAPEIAPMTAPAVPLRCHVGQPLPPGADQEQRLSSLQLHWTFLCTAYLLTLAISIFFFLGMGLVVPRPAVFLAPLAAIFALVSSAYLQYLVYLSRRAQHLIVTTLALVDDCFAELLHTGINAALGYHELPNSTKLSGGLYGDRVQWSLDDVQCQPLMLHTLCLCLSLALAVLGATLYMH